MKAAAATAKSARKTVLILGDSLTAGYGMDPDLAFPALLQKRIDAAQLPYEVINAGLSGDTSAGGLRRINWLLRQPVDVLILELGGNDGLRGISPEVTRSNLQQIVQRTKDKNPEMQLVVAGMQMPENMGAEFTREFREIFPDLAKANHGTLIPFLLQGVAGDSRLNQADMMHPNVAGHEILAANIWRVLEPLLRKQFDTTPRTEGARSES